LAFVVFRSSNAFVSQKLYSSQPDLDIFSASNVEGWTTWSVILDPLALVIIVQP